MLTFIWKKTAAALSKKLNDQKIQEAMNALPPITFPLTDDDLGLDEPGKVKVAALQLTATNYDTLAAFIADVDSHLAKAAGAGCRLVCFPEYFGLLPATISPVVRFALGFFGEKNPSSKAEKAEKPPLALPAYFAPFAFLTGQYISIMAGFAKRYNLYLSCGSVFALEGEKLFNRHILLAPTGEIIGQQDKLHLAKGEAEMGFCPGGDLCVVDTEIGRIALMVGTDACYTEPFLIAKALEADFVIVPFSDRAKFQDYLALRGAQLRVSESGLVAIKSVMVANPPFALRFSGKAGIYFPVDSGFSSQESTSSDGMDHIFAWIDVLALREKTSDVFCRPNPAFHEKYAAAICQKEGSTGYFGGEKSGYVIEIEENEDKRTMR